MFTVRICQKEFSFNAPSMLCDILREKYDKYCVAALVDGRVYDLNKVIDYIVVKNVCKMILL